METSRFIEAVEGSQTEAAYSMLTQEVQGQLDPEILHTDTKDFLPIVVAFNQVHLRTKKMYDASISISVTNVGGQPRDLKFYLVKENKLWKIQDIELMSIAVNDN